MRLVEALIALPDDSEKNMKTTNYNLPDGGAKLKRDLEAQNAKVSTSIRRVPYQPKTGAKCGCKRGIERDNCANCEGTGWVIDFARIRNQH